MRPFKGQEDVKVICTELIGNFDDEIGRSDLESQCACYNGVYLRDLSSYYYRQEVCGSGLMQESNGQNWY